jgi:hypothetical protein
MKNPIGSMTAEDLRRNMMRTYFSLRIGIMTLSLALPMLAYGYSLRAHGGLLEGSLSAFYGADGGAIRNWFVGILWAVGALLILYKGFSVAENWLLNFAGSFVVLTAMTPCNCSISETGAKNMAHTLFAVSFFVCMVAVAVFCAKDTINLLPKHEQARFRQAYNVLGVLMFLLPAAAVATAYIAGTQDQRVFIIETVAILMFVIYWGVKSLEFRITSAERKALYGSLRNERGVGVVHESVNVERVRQLA